MDVAGVLALRELETVELVAPVGLQFIDELTGTLIADGLQFRATLGDDPLRPITALAVSTSPSGVHILSYLPGRRTVELGTVPLASAAIPSVEVEVTDTANRFLPLRLRIDPTDVGLLRHIESQRTGPFPLFSAPARRAPAAVAVARALVLQSAEPGKIGAPAAWAVIEAWLGSVRLGRGCTDQRGAITLLMPYPDALSDPLGSPPGALLALSQQEWSLELRAYYGDTGSPPRPLDSTRPPELDALLAQPPATLWADAQHAHALAAVPLHYGRELTVSSDGAEGALLLTPTR